MASIYTAPFKVALHAVKAKAQGLLRINEAARPVHRSRHSCSGLRLEICQSHVKLLYPDLILELHGLHDSFHKGSITAS